MNIAETLWKVADDHGGKTGLIEAAGGNHYSFDQVVNRSSRYAAYFKSQGIGQGHRVMLMVRPSVDFICLTFSFFQLGAPVILIDPGMGYRNLLRCIAGVRPDYLVGIPAAIIFSRIFAKTFSSLKKRFCCGPFLGVGHYDLKRRAAKLSPTEEIYSPDQDSVAAIIFTTGSTGPPKGVRFEHRIFASQLGLIRDYYQIGPDDIDQPGFPLFGLFSVALGATAVIPDMDPSRPATVDPERFVTSLEKYRVTYSFGSPAIWRVVSDYCLNSQIRLRSVEKVLMAGAPVPGDLIDRVYRILPAGARIFTPYGATESLPIVSIEGREIVGETWNQTRRGRGTCVGRPLPGIEVKVIEPVEGPLKSAAHWHQCTFDEIGEIVVKGDVVTRSYENNEPENLLSKVPDKDDGFWHRIGDLGYFDEHGRLWFCGRKAHRVLTRQGMRYTIPCEAIANEHPEVWRSALVGVSFEPPFQEPVMIVERIKGTVSTDQTIKTEVARLLAAHEHTQNIKQVLVHPSFPVDIRHNAKIFREQLKDWAQRRLRPKR